MRNAEWKGAADRAPGVPQSRALSLQWRDGFNAEDAKDAQGRRDKNHGHAVLSVPLRPPGSLRFDNDALPCWVLPSGSRGVLI